MAPKLKSGNPLFSERGEKLKAGERASVALGQGREGATPRSLQPGNQPVGVQSPRSRLR